MPFARYFCIFINVGLGETINKASGAMQKSANGSDISDVSAFRNALQLGTAATRDVGDDGREVTGSRHLKAQEWLTGHGSLYPVMRRME
ncbi:hypothetical protein MUTS8_34800 [Escherichia coli]|nr:hypothetical protein MUTS8_34800 [Escherichia coli]